MTGISRIEIFVITEVEFRGENLEDGAETSSGWPSAKSSLSDLRLGNGEVSFCSVDGFFFRRARERGIARRLRPLMSSAKRRRIKETGALPGRKPKETAGDAAQIPWRPRSIAFVTSSAGISRVKFSAAGGFQAAIQILSSGKNDAK